MFVGRRLTLARRLAEMRKNELAEHIGKTPTAIASYEAGKSRPSAPTVARLCIATELNSPGVRPPSATKSFRTLSHC
ncbi:MAG TPA: helix-turn-helix transcriptional regulator [Trebonia sp.]|nr:helix-turn-helix transcriptional regulator [Trebonia sp.]